MKVVLDTNVLVSGIFFGGVPAQILTAWRNNRFRLIASPLILAEYWRVAMELAEEFPDVEFPQVLDLIAIHSEIVEDVAPKLPVCRDPEDDKFLMCAAASRAILVSGDKDLLAADGTLDVRVCSPRSFLGDLTADVERA